MDNIDKVGGIIIQDKKLLVVRKITKDDRREYIIPGGKREGNETDWETLKRELMEELQVILCGAVKFGTYHDIAVFEQIPIHMVVYHTKIIGNPVCHHEIKEQIWIDKNYKEHNILLGSILEKYVVPQLIAKKLL